MKAENNIRKKNTVKNGTGLWAKFGPILALLLCLIIIILSRFSVSVFKEARQDIQKQIKDSFKININDARLTLERVKATGSVAAGMLKEDGVDYNSWASNIKYINESIDSCYMVSIVDTDGKGVCSIRDGEVDLSFNNYDEGIEQTCFIKVRNDKITGNAAVVCVVPIIDAGEKYGFVNLYIALDTFNQLFPIEGLDGSNGSILIQKDGDILTKNGVANRLSESNIYEFLNQICTEEELSDLTSKISSYITQDASIECEGKEYLVTFMPLTMADWTCIQIVEKNYIDNLVNKKVSNEKNLVQSLVIICFLTVVLITIVMVVNKTRDIQTKKALENKADTDLLTGLNNKIATETRIRECIDNESDSQHLLLLFDIDNFKKINDTMGHAFGDQVLKTLGEQLRQEFRKTDILGRTGGDEFTLLLKDLKSDEIVIKECNKIIDFFSQFKVGDYVKYSATASIGAAVYPRDGASFEELYSSADKALYESKKQGKNRLSYANEELTKLAKEAKNKASESEKEL